MRAAAGFAGLLALWALVAASGLVNPLFLASPGEVLGKTLEMLGSGRLAGDLGATGARMLAGVGLATLVGVPIGLALGSLRACWGYAEGALDFLRSIPPIVVYPVFLLAFGMSDASRVAVVVFGCSAVLIMHLAAAAGAVPQVRLASVRLIGATPWQTLRLVVLPEALPHLFVGLRTIASLGLIIVVVTEMLVGAEQGLGTRVINAQMAYRTDELYAGIVVIGLLGFSLNHLLAWLEARVVHWR